MPLHRIYHHSSAFSSTDKQTLSERITKLYTDVGLPAFYVVVLFIPIEQESFFVGGKPTDNFVRVVIQHLARQIPDEEKKRQFSENYENVLAPFIKDKGYDWEVNIQFFFFFINYYYSFIL
jgi:phenylpyruvate tautomerase PptA (4-oxalocrotonate tautomerase family)